MRDYGWARTVVPQDKLTLGELADLLGVGRHQARRLLLASGLPSRLLTRKWSYNGHRYGRKTYSIPPETAEALLEMHLMKMVKTSRSLLSKCWYKLGKHYSAGPFI
jgi:hypothetical protein